MEAEGKNKRDAFNIAHIRPIRKQMTHYIHRRRPMSTQRDYTSSLMQLQYETDWLTHAPETLWHHFIEYTVSSA